MKGLSMTLTIVIIAIVLLVTALVILTMFGGQMAAIATIFGGLQTDTIDQDLCNQRCSAYCTAHYSEIPAGVGGFSWTALGAGNTIKHSDGSVTTCDAIMQGIGVDICKC